MKLAQKKIWQKSLFCFALVVLFTAPAFSSTKMEGGILLAQEEEAPPPPPPVEDQMPPDHDPEPEPDRPAPSYSSSSSSSKPAQDAPKGKEEEEAAAAEKALRFKEPPPIPITESERVANCRKHEKQFISYLDQVFFVQNCKKYLLSTDQGSKLSRNGIRLTEVVSRVIASLGEGGDYSSLSKPIIRCEKFNKNYVTYNLKIYWVEDCKLREFPDSASMQDHRWKNRYFEKPVVVLEGMEFYQFKFGKPFDSILDKKGQNDLNFDTVVAIPNEEACRSIRGAYVSYLDTIYQIRRTKNGKTCWKEKVDSAEFTRKQGFNLSSLRELTSDQSFSIPDKDPTLVKNSKN